MSFSRHRCSPVPTSPRSRASSESLRPMAGGLPCSEPIRCQKRGRRENRLAGNRQEGVEILPRTRAARAPLSFHRSLFLWLHLPIFPCSDLHLLGPSPARTFTCSDLLLLGPSPARTFPCSDLLLLGPSPARTFPCSDLLLLGPSPARTFSCSDLPLLGPSPARTFSCSDRPAAECLASTTREFTTATASEAEREPVPMRGG